MTNLQMMLLAAASCGWLLGPSVHRTGAHDARTWRSHRTPTMLEAYDLMPVVECLKDGSSYDSVDACLDAISPWLQINEAGEVQFSLGAINGFIGGSVGVMGTVLATVVKKGQVKDRLKCSYCDGTGQIGCGHCLGLATLSMMDADTGKWSSVPCPNCEGTRTVVCINCQGSGISVPEDFLQALGDSEAGFSEDDYIGLFDEVKFPTVPPALDEPLARESAPATGKTSAKSEGAFGDPTGGLG
uniref:Uncharacterized protein n=1 Tax=Haptolina ericina TaxID=156174 RepID=A0A7S3EVL4_9EUKA